ncbi:hypothetical protein [Rhizobacter sp. LjRoot28]|uniref:hypothetical protein n=1 Tax=Rhizobacter sp. LjRoot28 TaxID=3342309 RepID=UPI003ED109A0
MAWIKNLGGFLDFLSLVIVHAPDDFPKEDYLGDDEQLTLERAFLELRDGMQFVAPKVSGGAALNALQAQLNQVLALYRQGDDVKGAHLLQDFEQRLLQEVR